MAKMTNDELASKLSNEIDSATGNFNTELSEQREQSMKYYLGEPFGNEIEGRSEIVTTDVRDTLNKAGYNVKQNTTAAERFKKRYGPVSK